MSMKSKVFIDKLLDVANNYNTVYMWGVFGAPVTERVIDDKAKQYPSWYTVMKKAKFRKLLGKGYYGFDCVCLIKSILWGWNGDNTKSYGGAVYASNGVPDIGADAMIKQCKNVSTTGWANMSPGEALWCSGHIGVYIGNGLAVECTPSWNNKVQITAVKNIGTKKGYNARTWTKHGLLPYIDYSDQAIMAVPSTPTDVVHTTKVVHSTGSEADNKAIWDRLLGAIGNEYGTAGLMGNLEKESALISNNVQGSYESKVGKDAVYTAKVDDGSYSETEFSKDQAGYGLAQWTYHTRKKDLYQYAKKHNRSIADYAMQCDFLIKELKGSYPKVWKMLTTATSVQEASDTVLMDFERPAKAESKKTERAAAGMKYFNKYAKSKNETTNTSSVTNSGSKSVNITDIVTFIGKKHFTSANSTSSKSCKMGMAKVTARSSGVHPLHLINISNSGATVHGWVDISDIVELSSDYVAVNKTVKVTAKALNVRACPTTDAKVISSIRDMGSYLIVGTYKGWGKLTNNAGWISLEYTK